MVAHLSNPRRLEDGGGGATVIAVSYYLVIRSLLLAQNAPYYAPLASCLRHDYGGRGGRGDGDGGRGAFWLTGSRPKSTRG